MSRRCWRTSTAARCAARSTSTGVFTLDVDGEEVKLEPDDVEIRAEQHEDLTLAQDGPHAVALDLTLDDDLRAEGIAREIIRAVNDRRKADGFALADRIAVELRSTTRIVDAASRHEDWILAEVLATASSATDELFDQRARRHDRRRAGLARPPPRLTETGAANGPRDQCGRVSGGGGRRRGTTRDRRPGRRTGSRR